MLRCAVGHRFFLTGARIRNTTLAVEDDRASRYAYKILYVEDHADTLEVIGRLLCSCGYAPILAASCADAIRAMETTEHIDVMIADLLLPDGDGGLVLHAPPRWPDLCGICLTGSAMSGDAERLALRVSGVT